MYHPGAVRLSTRVETEKHLDDFAPVCSLFFGHQQPEIDREMPLVLDVYAVRQWRPVLE